MGALCASSGLLRPQGPCPCAPFSGDSQEADLAGYQPPCLCLWMTFPDADVLGMSCPPGTFGTHLKGSAPVAFEVWASNFFPSLPAFAPTLCLRICWVWASACLWEAEAQLHLSTCLLLLGDLVSYRASSKEHFQGQLTGNSHTHSRTRELGARFLELWAALSVCPSCVTLTNHSCPFCWLSHLYAPT